MISSKHSFATFLSFSHHCLSYFDIYVFLTLLSGTDRYPTCSDRNWMPYTQAVMLEILRYGSQTPLAIPHKCKKGIVLSGYTIEAGTAVSDVSINIMILLENIAAIRRTNVDVTDIPIKHHNRIPYLSVKQRVWQSYYLVNWYSCFSMPVNWEQWEGKGNKYENMSRYNFDVKI